MHYLISVSTFRNMRGTCFGHKGWRLRRGFPYPVKWSMGENFLTFVDGNGALWCILSLCTVIKDLLVTQHRPNDNSKRDYKNNLSCIYVALINLFGSRVILSSTQ